MQWKNVKLIYLREMRDQLRDRRTLFLIAVLPLLLYPLLGTSFFQLSQFLQKRASASFLVPQTPQMRSAILVPPVGTSTSFGHDTADRTEPRIWASSPVPQRAPIAAFLPRPHAEDSADTDPYGSKTGRLPVYAAA